MPEANAIIPIVAIDTPIMSIGVSDDLLVMTMAPTSPRHAPSNFLNDIFSRPHHADSIVVAIGAQLTMTMTICDRIFCNTAKINPRYMALFNRPNSRPYLTILKSTGTAFMIRMSINISKELIKNRTVSNVYGSNLLSAIATAINAELNITLKRATCAVSVADFISRPLPAKLPRLDNPGKLIIDF